MTHRAYRVGIDVGGTFTDLVAVDRDSGNTITLKVPSTPQAPERAVLDAIKTFMSTGPDRNAREPAVALLCHSTTIATNALLGQLNLDLPRVGLLTTLGFRDVLEIGRQARSEVYNLFVVRPRPLAERCDRLGVPERVNAHGSVIQPLDEGATRQALAQLRAAGVRDVAVVFLHSYANSVHERKVSALAAAEFPEMAVTLSSDVDPEYREYERASTTVVTAVLRPIVGDYLRRLEEGVRALGVQAPLLVMGSHGGMADLDATTKRPAAIIESGPAGGLSAAAGLAARLGLERVLSFDMGGTTAKAGAVMGGTPETVAEFEAAGRTHSGRYVRGSGYPVRFPFLDLAEVSAGGGTIAHLDRGGALRVGPISAGADPGPVCYGRGGADPTVTDANLILGRLNPNHLLGGAMPIDRSEAERAIAVLGARVALNPLELAAGVVRLIDAEMARALRIVSIERGHDPRRFAMIAFGGGGPLHACALASALGVRRVIVPRGPGLFSAAGLLTSPLKVSLVRPVLGGLTVAGPGQLADLFVSMAAEAGADLRRQAADKATIRSVPTLDMRYVGQSFELNVSVTPSAEAWLDEALTAFHARHRAVYGYASPNHEVEIVAARLAATAPAGVEVAIAPLASPPQTSTAPRNHRPVFFDQAGGFTVTPVYWRDDLPVGVELTGPAVIEQYDATTLLHPGWRLAVDVYGNLRLEAASAPAD